MAQTHQITRLEMQKEVSKGTPFLSLLSIQSSSKPWL